MTSKILDIFYRNPHQFISTMLVGNNIALVVYGLQMAIILEPLIARVVNNEALIVLTQSIISTILILFTGEFIPKTVFKLNPNFSLTLFSVPLLIIYVVLYPVSKFSSLLSFLILKIAGVKNVTGSTQRALGKVDLDYFIQQSIEDAPQNSDMDTEVKIFQNALDFSNVRLRDCIVPRTEIVACDKTAALEELRSRFVETGLSKILVYNENIDDIVGYIHSSEMFKNPEDWTQSIRSVSIVPETMAANKLMKVLMQDKKSMAVVVDEFGGTSGIVTLEDLVEEILREKAEEERKTKISNVQVGLVTEGVVESLQPYGAFVDLGNGLSGLVHISQICEKRIKKPSEVLTVGDKVKVKVTAVKDGKLSLSIKEATDMMAKEIEEEVIELPDSKEEASTSLGALFANIKLDN